MRCGIWKLTQLERSLRSLFASVYHLRDAICQTHAGRVSRYLYSRGQRLRRWVVADVSRVECVVSLRYRDVLCRREENLGRGPL